MIKKYWLTLFVLLVLLSVWSGMTWAQSFYSLHIWSYRKAPDAREAVNNLRNRGLDAFTLRELVVGQGLWYRIYVGRFSARREAKALAEMLIRQGVLSVHSNYSIRLIEGRRSREVVAPNQRPRGRTGAEGPKVSAFRESVEGSYVGSYKDEDLARKQAEGLTLRGWPAYVSEGIIQGKKWYRVYLSPTVRQHAYGLLRGFEILIDLSLTSPADGYQCQGLSRFEVMREIMRRINAAVPNLELEAALRTVGQQESAAASNLSLVLWGLSAFDRSSYGSAIGNLRPSPSQAPLGWGVAASDSELAKIPGKKALILLSDFQDNRRLGEPLLRARALKNKYDADLCLYPIYVGEDLEGLRLARDLARVGECGSFYDACLLLNDQCYFDSMIQRIFHQARCVDSDADGVCDDDDQCSKTPLGAPVDARGCWIAAFANYFDFDKSELKKKYLPNLKQAADILKLNPGMSVIIAGHTDNKGGWGYNMELGYRRADAVRQALLEYGVDGRLMQTKSYGESRPIADNATEAGRARNRRVEFEGWGLTPYH